MYSNFQISRKYPESNLAHKYLDGMVGVEIGGSAHNPFGLNTVNVDRYESMDTEYKKEEFSYCGERLKVDIVAEGDDLPFDDNSFDFVISSHVLEHFYNPINALKEWARIAKEYIFIVVPHKERTFDRDRPLTLSEELLARREKNQGTNEDTHHNVWDTNSFLDFLDKLGYNVIDHLDIDDKVGNGIMAVIKI